MNKPTVNIIFDLDGTISNPSRGIIHAYQYAFNKINITPPSHTELLLSIGAPLHKAFEKWIPPILIEYGVRCFREYYNDTGWHENELYSGISDLIIKLNAKKNKLFFSNY